MKTRKTIIVAPHADDEIIGCFHILTTSNNLLVLFDNLKAWDEAKESSDYFQFEKEIITDALYKLRWANHRFFFPDPYFELHPLHRKLGAIGESFVREDRENVFFYTTNMNAPYIRELQNGDRKQVALDSCYPDKKSLWKYDHKYFLFEGHCKWVF